jgi:hypothetical protein
MSEIIRPPREMVLWAKNKLRELGISEIDQYPDDFLAAVIGAGVSWFYSPTGSEQFNKMFGLTREEGKETHTYKVVDGFGNQRQVKHDDMVFFSTIFAKGQPISANQLIVEKKSVIFCDECGMGGHCPKEIRDKYTGKTKHICNHCLVHNESLREHGDNARCTGCPAKGCDYWNTYNQHLRRVV